MNSNDPDNHSKKSILSDPKEWLSEHGDILFGYALRLVSDRLVAEDLVQETLLAALKARASFSGSSSERTWLVGILKNKVVDYYRKSGRETNLERPDDFSDYDDSDYISKGPDAGTWQPERRPKDWSVDPNDPVEQQEFWKHLINCLDKIDQRLALVYCLREIEEMEYKEVCNVLSVTATNLRVMLYRARKLLRRCLETNWIDS